MGGLIRHFRRPAASNRIGSGGTIPIQIQVSYDISDDRLRERVADRLGTFGWRVQESVFECTFDPDALPDVIAALSRELGEAENAEVRIYRICRECLAAAVGIGKTRHLPDEGACVIV